jgi:signal peptidase I
VETEKARRSSRARRRALGALLLLAAARGLVAEPVRVASLSMFPTLGPSDVVLVSRIAYGARLPLPFTRLELGRRDPQPGDVVALRWPAHPGVRALKRVIAVGGQTVAIRAGTVLVDGARPTDTHAFHVRRDEMPVEDYGPLVVPAGHVFVMGDNRDESIDSGAWGSVPVDLVDGRAVLILWSRGGRDNAPLWSRIGAPV